MVDITQRNARLGQAIADRFGGEAAPVLDSSETLLFNGRDQLAILHQTGGSVGVKGIQPEDVSHPERLPNPTVSISRRNDCISVISLP